MAVVGRDNWLACVWVAGAPTPAGRARGRDVAVQNLCYALWDVTHMHEATRGRLPLGPGATLTWLGFSEEVRGMGTCAESYTVVGSGSGTTTRRLYFVLLRCTPRQVGVVQTT